MAASRAKSLTLTPNVATPINFPQYFATITVVNRSLGTDVIWLRIDGNEPVIAADDNYPVLPSQAQTFPNGVITQEPITRVISGTTVFLISSTACPVTVYGT